MEAELHEPHDKDEHEIWDQGARLMEAPVMYKSETSGTAVEDMERNHNSLAIMVVHRTILVDRMIDGSMCCCGTPYLDCSCLHSHNYWSFGLADVCSIVGTDRLMCTGQLEFRSCCCGLVVA